MRALQHARVRSRSLLVLVAIAVVPPVGSPGADSDRQATRLLVLKAARWQLAHPKHPENDWTNGAFYAGVFAAWETTRDPGLMSAMLAMGERLTWQPGPRVDHADDIAISQTFIDLSRVTKDRRMIQPTVDQIARLRAGAPGHEAEVHGITWWWCDALFMAPPTFAKLAATLHDPSYLAESDALFRQTWQRLYSAEEHLFARDDTYLWNAAGEGKREANGKKIFWSRGNGWVAGGLVRLLKELPKNDSRRPFYLSLYTDMMARVVSLQQPDGLWRSSLLDPGAYPGGEASGSGFFTYALAWGVRAGVLDRKTYAPAVRRAWAGLLTLVNDEGRVGWVQPIGADPRRDFSPDSWEVYGTGAFLLAGSEVIQLK
jgi:unsaturated rhamnogalacturonyl hydrolase